MLDSTAPFLEVDAAINFVWSLPTKFIHITYMNPQRGPITGQSYRRTEKSRANLRTDIEKAQAREFNCYFNDADVKPLGKSHPKARKDDVLLCHYLHCDCEPDKTLRGAEFEADKARLLARLQADPQPPTIITDSGNGLQAFWQLAEPTSDIGAVEARNIVLRDKWQGDNCQDVSHILRLPHTINFANEQKIARGRPAQSQAKVVVFNEFETYKLSEFEAGPSMAPDVPARPARPARAAPAETDEIDILETVDLSRINDRDFLKLVIDGAPAGADRSKQVYLVACNLRREYGYNDGEIVHIITNLDYGISDHIRDAIVASKRTPEAQAARIIARMNEEGVETGAAPEEEFNDLDDDEIAQWQKHDEKFQAKGAAGSKSEPADDLPLDKFKAALASYIACIKPPIFIHRARREMISEKQFDYRFNPVVNAYLENKKGMERYRDHAAKLALATTGLERVDGMCYRPGEDVICAGPRGDRLFNMWIDPKIEPLDGEPSIIVEHFDYLIPDPTERKLVLDFIAWIFQHPTEKLMFALLIVDHGGTGKSWIGLLLRVLLGRENIKLLSDDDPVKDMFNGYSENKQVVVCNEASPDGKANILPRFKGVITEDTLQVNEKFIPRHEIENRSNVIAFSNHPEALKTTRTDRRWAMTRGADDPFGVSDSGEGTKQTTAYYNCLFDCIGTPEMPGDEARRFLGWLKRRDLSKFDGKSIAARTDTKDELADNQLTQLEWGVIEAHRTQRGPFKGVTLIAAGDVLDGLNLRYNGDELAALTAVGKALYAGGCRRVGPQLYIDGARVRLWATSKTLATQYAKLTKEKLKALYCGQAKKRDDDSGLFN